MKNTFLILSFLIIVLNLNAQNAENKKYLLTNYLNTTEVSALSLTDPYLSPLKYSGIGVSYNTENSRFLTAENSFLSRQNKLKLQAGLLLNPRNTAAMMNIGMNYGWGMYYHFRINKDFQLLAGGLWDADFGFKYLDRNVNNPVNLDLATNLNLTGKAKYDLPFRRKTLQLQLEVQTPVMGCMFVPLGGASYFEMFQLGNLTDAFHFSSLYNKRGLNTKFVVEVPFNRSVWHFGFRTSSLKYSSNNLVFKRNEYSLVVGTSFDGIKFAGKKNKAPENFINSNK
jgi:hypothetical protein